MFCNDCLTEAKSKTRTENESEREKTQAKIPISTACLSLWFRFGVVSTEVLKVPTCFPACHLPGEVTLLGCWYEEGPHESAEGCTLTFPAEGN